MQGFSALFTASAPALVSITPVPAQETVGALTVRLAPNVAVQDALSLSNNARAAQKGAPFDPDGSMVFPEGCRSESPRGAVETIAADAGAK